ncbi:MAG: SMI1/KNR4 family protein [Zoogloeaceae bacterium]|nr:SMI1/KNR4 family protein [Zoogloeaceae bacterium]
MSTSKEQALMTCLQQWHEQDQHTKILAAVEALEASERTPAVLGLYARALNNAGRYAEALEQLNQIPSAHHDASWYWRLGYALYFLKREKEAAAAFRAAQAAGETNPDMPQWIEDAEKRAAWRAEKERREAARRALRSPYPAGHVPFADFDFDDFWDDDAYALKNYVGAPVTDEAIASIEAELGYRLPASYVALIRQHNGGRPKKTAYFTAEGSSWAEDHIAIHGIYGIDRNKANSLCGELGNKLWREEWGYPNIGIAICDTPSAGHDMVCLDYRFCGPQGEPTVVCIDQECDYEITWIADDFESFIRGLQDEEDFD